MNLFICNSRYIKTDIGVIQFNADYLYRIRDYFSKMKEAETVIAIVTSHTCQQMMDFCHSKKLPIDYVINADIAKVLEIDKSSCNLIISTKQDNTTSEALDNNISYIQEKHSIMNESIYALGHPVMDRKMINTYSGYAIMDQTTADVTVGTIYQKIIDTKKN